MVVDSYDWKVGRWRWGEQPLNNIIIPLLLAPPFFAYLLVKQRQLATAHRELLVLAGTDPLTSCLNRRALAAVVEAYLDRMQTAGSGALLVVDVDHFKIINDTHGHETGDEALKSIATAIRTSVRDTDPVGRIGGEEFRILLPSVTQERAEAVAEAIRTGVAKTDLLLAGTRMRVTISVGGAFFARSDITFSQLYRHADEQLYVAKRMGRNISLMTQLRARPGELVQ